MKTERQIPLIFKENLFLITPLVTDLSKIHPVCCSQLYVNQVPCRNSKFKHKKASLLRPKKRHHSMKPEFCLKSNNFMFLDPTSRCNRMIDDNYLEGSAPYLNSFFLIHLLLLTLSSQIQEKGQSLLLNKLLLTRQTHLC